MSDDVVDVLERAIANNPNASPMEIVAQADVNPGEYLDVVRELLAGDDPDSGESLNNRTPDRVRGSGTRPSTDPEEDLPTIESEPGVPAENLVDRRMWMPWERIDGRKQPHAIYADTDNAMSYSDPGNWREYDAVEMACHDPRLEGPGIVLQHEADPYANEADPFFVVDYDDVRDPETDEVHPLVADHVDQAESYADVSTSGTGVHIIAIGQLPEDVKTIQTALPDHDAFPDAEIEVYDGKRYVAMTGAHVVDTPTVATDAQAFLDELVDEFVTEEERRSTPRPEAEDWDPEYDAEDLEEMETTTDLQAIYDACRQVEPRDIRLRSSFTEERGDGTKSFDPSWETSRSGTRLGWDPDIGWIYRNGDVGLDGLQVVALEERIITSVHEYPTGADWWRAVEALRDRGARIPEFEPETDDDDPDGGRPALLDAAIEADGDVEIEGRPTSTLPIDQLDALEQADRRRFAKRRGLEWPATDDARDRLFSSIAEVVRNEDDRVVDAPTALGKSFTIASTRWGARADITGDRPVVHLLETRDARDEAIDVAEEHGGSYHVLLGRHEACPVAAGEFDDELTINGESASHWLDAHCNTGGKGLPFSAAHRHLEEHNDQGEALPCCEDGECTAIAQWETYREGPDGDLEYWPLVIATHNFAFAPGLRTHNNVVVDEEPDFQVDDLDTGRIREAVGAFLREIDAPVTTWEAFVQLSLHADYRGDAARERDALQDALRTDPDRDWYFEDPDAHVLAPALARAIFHAEERANGRRFGKTIYEPPRLEAHAHDDDDWNREWVSVVLDESNDVQTVRVVPDFGAARSLVGLDAHPAAPIWQANTVPWIKSKQVLDPTERRLWRRYERGLRVVQVGDATRPLSGEDAPDWFESDRKLDVELEHLVDEYGTLFRTAITTAQVEDDLEERMADAGCHKPELMHFGEEKSRNDFANERIGLVNGCMDPGDDYVLDLLAELDLEAEVETAVDDDGEEYRARGRGFEGDDAETAEEILASVRENHIAQAAGRYARNAEDPESTATVFVRTDAIPTGFADVQVAGAEWVFTDLQEAIVDELRSTDASLTAREIADAVGCSKEHVRTTLERLAEAEDGDPPVQLVEGVGDHGATLYSEDGLPHSGVCDIQESPTDAYRTTSRWVLAIRDPTTHGDVSVGGDGPASEGQTRVWNWRSPPDPGD